MTKASKGDKWDTLFGISNFGHWDLFVIWDLIFGISILKVGRQREAGEGPPSIMTTR
jgi:hypothetical protein